LNRLGSFARTGLLLAASIVWCCAAHAQGAEPLSPLPAAPAGVAPERVALGKKLFRDTRFAKDNSVACISCHSPDHGGADPRPYSVGSGGALQLLNTPSIWNVGLNFRQQWAGGTTTLEDLVGVVLKSPRVFNSSWEELLPKLQRDAELSRDFTRAYPEGMTPKTIADALAVYQRTLVTPSRFDRYLQGNTQAISPDELRGY